MDGLINLTLINSAKFDYADINLDGNTLFIGANGAGKTTLLRAVLFFYTGNSEGLGINSSKKTPFVDYYFPFENSYLVYTYKKSDKYILVFAYKDRNSLKFVFNLFNTFPKIKEIFIDSENRAKEFSKIRETLKTISNSSDIIQSGAKYKEILYTKNNLKAREFSLFEAKDYDSFVKSLTNIFINSKVDSEIIKKVIISSLELQSSIDIEQIQRYLLEFNKIHNDIKLFDKSKKSIEKLIFELKEYEEILALMKNNFKTLYSSKEALNIKLEDEKNSLLLLENNFSNLQNEFDKKSSDFSIKKDKKLKEEAIIEDFLKNCNLKKEFYKKENIFDKIDKYSKINEIKDDIARLKNRKDTLLNEHKSIEQDFENQKNSAKNSFVEKNLEIERKESFLNIELEKKKTEVILKTNSKKDEIKQKYKESEIKNNNEQNRYEIQVLELKNKIKEQKNSLFVFSQEDVLIEQTNLKNSLELKIKDDKNFLDNLQKSLEFEEKVYFTQKENLEKDYKKDFEYFNLKLKNILEILNPKDGSLVDIISKNSKNISSYLSILKDDFLKKDFNIDFELKEFKNMVFELDFKDFEFLDDNYEEKRKTIENDMKFLKNNFENSINSLNEDFTKKQAKLLKEKNRLNELIIDSEKSLTVTKTRIDNLLIEKSKEERLFKETCLSNITILESELTTLENKKLSLKQIVLNLKHDEQNEVRIVENEQNNRIKILEEELNKHLKKYISERNNNSLRYELILKDIDNEYKKLLKDKNIDINELDLLKKQENELFNNLNEIESYLKIIISYEKDKQELFDLEDEKITLLNKINKGFNDSFKEYKLIENEFILNKNSIEDKIVKAKTLISEMKSKSNEITRFENSGNFNRYKSLGFVYETNNQIVDDIFYLVNSLENLKDKMESNYKNIEDKISKLDDIFYSETLGIKRELDAISSARNLERFYLDEIIEHKREFLGSNIQKIIKDIVDSYDKLLDSQGKIKKLIGKITKIFDSVQINVIDKLELRYQDSSHKIIEIFSQIKQENEEQAFGFSINLFNDTNRSSKIIKLLIDLIEVIEQDSSKKVELEDSFILEFRVIENGNDSKWVSTLDMIGSNGTDVLVKSLLFLAMLQTFKEQITKKDLVVQVVLDEVGILSQRYLKELIEFANRYGIYFVNGAPDEKLIGTYKRVNLISNKNSKSSLVELVFK